MLIGFSTAIKKTTNQSLLIRAYVYMKIADVSLTTHRLYILVEIETINFFGEIFALSMNNLGIFKVCYNYFGDVNLGVLLCLLPSYIRRLPYGYRVQNRLRLSPAVRQ